MSMSQVQESKPSRLAGAPCVLSVPVWVIALLFAMAAKGMNFIEFSFDYEYESLFEALSTILLVGIFLAGAIQRLNWRHALVLGGLLAFGKGVEELGYCPGLAVYLTGPYGWLVMGLPLLWLLGIGEMLTAHRRSWRTAGYLLLAAIGIAAVRSIVMMMIKGAELEWYHDADSLWSSSIHSLGGLVHWPVMALISWWGLTAAFAAIRRGRRGLVTAGGVLVVVMVFHWLFWAHLVFALAQMSIEGRGPFSRNVGIQWVARRGRAEDFEAILEQARQADWESPRTAIFEADWRVTAVNVLSRREDTAEMAAGVFSEMLRTKRSKVLASCTAQLMVDQRRLEVVPILFRYALEPYPTWPVENCREALERLRVPEAGILTLVSAIAYDRPEPEPEDFPISPERREHLAALLGKDVGDSWVAWRDALAHAVDEEPSSLPDDVQEEVDRELKCYNVYVGVRSDWLSARAAVIQRRLAAAGKMGQFQKVLVYTKEKGGRFLQDWEIPAEIRSAVGDLIAVRDAATKDMAVPEPDLDASTIQAFEKEIDAYVDRVHAVINKYLPSEPEPAE